ncbi:MAG: hypothetical protein WCQ50_16115 [Spirochaetota bacterium]
MVTFKHWVNRFNEKLALYGTQMFGTMWAFYLFFVWGLLGMLPFLPVGFKGIVLLVSSAWIQLWALPLLAVGNAVLNKTSERRAKQDHETLKAQFQELRDLQMDNDKILSQLDRIEAHLNKQK